MQKTKFKTTQFKTTQFKITPEKMKYIGVQLNEHVQDLYPDTTTWMNEKLYLRVHTVGFH